MIYIENTPNITQLLLVPREKADAGDGGYAFSLLSDIDNVGSIVARTAAGDYNLDFNGDFFIESVDIEVRGQYWSVTARLPQGLPDGSYTYMLLHGGEVIARGLAQVGGYGREAHGYDIEREAVEYDEGERESIEYDIITNYKQYGSTD